MSKSKRMTSSSSRVLGLAQCALGLAMCVLRFTMSVPRSRHVRQQHGHQPDASSQQLREHEHPEPPLQFGNHVQHPLARRRHSGLIAYLRLAHFASASRARISRHMQKRANSSFIPHSAPLMYRTERHGTTTGTGSPPQLREDRTNPSASHLSMAPVMPLPLSFDHTK